MSLKSNVLEDLDLGVNSEEGLPELDEDVQAQLMALLEGSEEPDPEVDVNDLAMQIAAAIQQTYQSGDQVAFLVVNPVLIDRLRDALKALPDEAFPPFFKDRLPLQPDENEPHVKIITATHLETEFLRSYFGPPPGGNNKIPRLLEYLQKQPYPVRITLETLRALYILDVMKRTGMDVDIAVPGSQLFTGIRRP